MLGGFRLGSAVVAVPRACERDPDLKNNKQKHKQQWKRPKTQRPPPCGDEAAHAKRTVPGSSFAFGLLDTGVCEISTHLDGAGVSMSRPRSPYFERCPTAADKNEGLFHRPIALTSRMSVNIDIRADGGSPTLTTSRTRAYFTDTCSAQVFEAPEGTNWIVPKQ